MENNYKLFDERTEAQHKADFEYGKKKEAEVVAMLRKLGQVYIRLEEEQHGVQYIVKYGPDCIIVGRLGVMPLEIKYTDIDLREVHWKLNQFQEAQKIGGYLLQISKDKFALFNTEEYNEGIIEKGYCNKPCIVFREGIKWYPINQLQLLF